MYAKLNNVYPSKINRKAMNRQITDAVQTFSWLFASHDPCFTLRSCGVYYHDTETS